MVLPPFLNCHTFCVGACHRYTATARKLAVIIYNMVVKGVEYENPKGYLYLYQKRKLGLSKRIRKLSYKFGITTEYLGLITSNCTTVT
jgi:hypothetical protein